MKLDLGSKTSIVLSWRPMAVTVIRWNTRRNQQRKERRNHETVREHHREYYDDA